MTFYNKYEDHNTIVYIRTSSRRNKQDIEQQYTYLKKKYPNAKFICEFADGMDYNRKGFGYIIKQIQDQKINRLVAMSEDIILQKDFKQFKNLCKICGCKVVIHDNTKSFFNFKYFYD